MGDVAVGQELEAVGDLVAPNDQLVDVKGWADIRIEFDEGSCGN
jgi:hypothetical protein